MPGSESFDLDLYFARIGYSGPHTSTLDVLSNLQQLHARAIPFENLDPLIGRHVSLRQKDLAAKLIGNRRGGYCFEQNTLFAKVLLRLGFHVTPLIARVL
jgi:N-hydroxyarylamine O-acetyltransferase